jgi:hypothetical protein
MSDYYDASPDDGVSYCPECGEEMEYGECECGYMTYARSLQDDPDHWRENMIDEGKL